MVSSKKYLEYILGQLSGLDDIRYRPMMGEFILYYKDKVIGGIYDDRLLVKPVESATAYVSIVSYVIPYAGAKEMLLIDDTDIRERLIGLFKVMYGDLPAPKKKK